MVQELNARGICVTCIYRSDCLSLKNSMKEGKPVLHCEEFDDSASKIDSRPKKEFPGTNKEELKDVNFRKSLEVKGLCINCDDNHICKVPYFGKNVIYCEEYYLFFPVDGESRYLLNTSATIPCFSIKNLILG